MSADPAGSTAGPARGPVLAILGCGLVTAVALMVLPVLTAPVRGAVTVPELIGAALDDVALLPVWLVSAVAVAIVGIGAWLVAGTGTVAARRRAAVAVVALAVGGLVAGFVELAVVSDRYLDDGGTGTTVLVAVGSWFVLAGLVGAAGGAIAELMAAAGQRSAIGQALGYPLLALLAVASATAIAVEGEPWTAGMWGAMRRPAASATCPPPPGDDPAGSAADNAVDGRAGTAWRCAGDGVGEQLVVDLGRARQVASIGLLPGYARVDADRADRYAQHRRVARVRYTFDDGSSREQVLDTSMANRTVQFTDVPAVRTRRVVVTVLASVPGVGAGDVAAVDATAVSAVVFR
ncbi:MAG: discoidin domain-containing protein [Pseudonocardia sp.]